MRREDENQVMGTYQEINWLKVMEMTRHECTKILEDDWTQLALGEVSEYEREPYLVC